MNKITSIIATIILSLGISSCDDSTTSSLPKPDPSPEHAEGAWKVNKDIEIVPEKIEIEMHVGHSHLKEGTEGDLGELFWSKTGANTGFHANPDTRTVEFPYKTVQQMVYERQADGTYKLTSESTDALRFLSSFTKTGAWTAVVVRLMDKQGKRMDLDLRSPQMRDRVQMFWTVSDIKPLHEDVALDKEMKQEKAFYFWYFDREGDDPAKYREVLKTPLGFRGVVQCQEPLVKYSVNLILTILPEGKSKESAGLKNSISLTKEQSEYIAFQFSIPCRNITRALGEGLNNDPFAPDYDELEEKEEKRYFSEIAREYPPYTADRIKELQEEAWKLPFEGPGSSNFWL